MRDQRIVLDELLDIILEALKRIDEMDEETE